jgi:hypothetical protein
MVDKTSPPFSLLRRHLRLVAICVVGTLAITSVLALGLHRSSAVPSSPPLSAWATPRTITAASLDTTTPATAAAALPVATAAAPPTPSTAVVPVSVPAPAVVTAPVVVPPVPVEPPIATLVAEVEAAGIEPGSNWSWSVGDTATHCGLITGSGTGCTYGAFGLEYTVFAGSPDLSLVAHELANAETQNDAVPSLLNEVAAADGGSSRSPTDAVASCLVTHFLGIQDEAAGPWTCSQAVAAFVADNIHDTLLTTVGALPA